MLEKLQRALGLKTNPVIFFSSALLVLVFVVVSIAFTDQVDTVFRAASDWAITNLGWFYILGVTSFLVFLLWIAFSRYGHVRLGGKDSRPEYSNVSWFGMLFAAGIGTILMFWGVAEPVNHFANPPFSGAHDQVADAAESAGSSQEFAEQLREIPVGAGDTAPLSENAANEAIGFSLYHFGFHTWAIFALPALAFAYFAYKRGLPFRVSSIFHPLLGDRINGPIGKTIDIVAVIGTLFGVAVSIGLGTLQINSGLNQLFGFEIGATAQILIIAVVTTIATISVVTGLDKGIKWLSNINIWMAVGLLLVVLIAGSTVFLLRGVIESTGNYLSMLVPLSFWNDALPANDWGWQGSWTVFYWAWTITWAPFVGIFVARISKGRTVREFVMGVLGAPVVFSIIWFSIFGMSSINLEWSNPGSLVGPVVQEGDTAASLFAFLENFPAAEFLMALSVLIVVIFFTTSSDSASLVVDMLTSGNSVNPPVRQRVFWALLQGLVAATLIAATGEEALAALQQVITVIGLPFFLIAFVMMYSLVKALKRDTSDLELLPRRARAMLERERRERDKEAEVEPS
ncbi:multidrug DMT transporter permease [Saccharomonospora piscinae]|uniref:Multidrug DMT transporter permease n=1 Tax=Saccharomonospora piscinae TaxID=687388 RepID=A0A1V8ZXN7_SACPI|nr:BCCT family transporter [Saccharomonospora piscinae]OQO89632.1 multidrug DMT transporter permease [Saccharomonospora piscinae]TLW91324.1 BCCT family transporter [Saccharomonospora piscinae]